MNKPTTFGKYFLLERIHAGSTAEVFRSKAFGVEGFERLIVVKRILSTWDKAFIQMFIEEAKLAVALNHANIAQIFDLGVVDGSYYIALEHVHGRDLRAILERCRQHGEAMPIAQACFAAMKVCEGLDYAHNKRSASGDSLNAVHGDVSPGNILVSFEGEVKLIDFRITKGAVASSRTQTDILKGKLSYFSPEQLRGKPVDRRSDVFSCGAVLYELLTGERLFAGDSELAVFQKILNVEILPPSTYNRKIPDELERIVLKALSKDVDARYQSAIDLHDELQAFVYTAGEFYSRKDLAGWMKRTFGKEIEEETVKLEGYRQLRPPMPIAAPASSVAPPPVLAAPASASAVPPAPASAPAVPPAPAFAAGSLNAAPALERTSEPAEPSTMEITVSDAITETAVAPVVVGRVSTPNRPSVPRSTQPVGPGTRPPAPQPASRSQSVPVAARPASPPRPRSGKGRLRPADAGWDDDDVETRLYDDDAKHKAKRANLPLQPPVSSSPGIALAVEDPAAPRAAPDLSSLVRNPRSWDPLVSTEAFPDVMSQRKGAHPGSGPGPAQFPVGSSDVPAPLRQDPTFDPAFSTTSDPMLKAGAGAREAAPATTGRQRGAATRAPHGAHEVPYDAMAAFGARFAAARGRPDRRGLLTIVLGSATVAAVAVIAVLVLSEDPRPAPRPTPAQVARPAAVTADPNTGFDLYVTPAGMTQWKLDGESRTDRLPSRIRGIAAGTHTVQIEPPPGFMSQFQNVTVELGKAPKVEIVLQPIPGLVGVFESTPPGATVSLITDGKRQPVGPSPARAPLDPRTTVQVLFEKPGYVSVNRPIAFTGVTEERVTVILEKAAPDRPAPPQVAPAQRKPAQPVEKMVDKPDSADRASDRPAETAPAAETPEPERATSDDGKARGILVLSSKPPCEILIDGSPTGLHTPQKEILLTVGRHRITLVNTEFDIRESFSVDIKADAPEKMIKDYSDRLPDP